MCIRDRNIVVVEKVSENNGEIIKNGLLESNMVNNNSADEVLVEIESSNKIVDDGRLGWQRANFPHDLSGVKTPIVFYEDKVSSSSYVRDEVSLSRSPVYHKFPGRARMCYDNVALPFVWRERVKWGWVSDFDKMRDIELFMLRERERWYY